MATKFIEMVSTTKKNKESTEKKPPKKRVITETKKWDFTEEELAPPYQWSCTEAIKTNSITTENVEHCNMVLRQIHYKMKGYQAQDIEKGFFLESEFVDVPYIIDLLYESRHLCFYCREPVKVLYEIVREPKQWSLDRLDNSIGHNKQNLVIACLQCNLRRKTMHHERYVFTKQLVITKEPIKDT